MFAYKDKLYRMTQSTNRIYGDGLDMKLLTKISMTDILQEELVPEFRAFLRSDDNAEEWSSSRFHHMDLHPIKNSDGSELWVGVMDGDFNMFHANPPNLQKRCRDLKNIRNRISL
jgi:hypothetical protein